MSDAKTLEDLQTIVDEWISQWEEGYFRPLSNFARLTEEVGELSRILNDRFGDKPAKDEFDDEALAEELGDILFMVICLANDLDVDLSEAFRKVIDKYDMRDADRYTPKS